MTCLMPRGGPPGKRALNSAAEVPPRRNAAQRAAKQTGSREVSRTLLGLACCLSCKPDSKLRHTFGAGSWRCWNLESLTRESLPIGRRRPASPRLGLGAADCQPVRENANQAHPVIEEAAPCLETCRPASRQRRRRRPEGSPGLGRLRSPAAPVSASPRQRDRQPGPLARKSRDHSAGVARSEMAISKVWKVPPCNTVILSSVIDTIRVPSLSTDPTQYRTPSSISM